MKRTVYRLKAGNLKAIATKGRSTSPLGDNEVTIRVKAIGLNFADVFAIWGLYKATPKEAFIPGLGVRRRSCRCRIEGYGKANRG